MVPSARGVEEGSAVKIKRLRAQTRWPDSLALNLGFASNWVTSGKSQNFKLFQFSCV
jgi:hypothetical protein